MAIPTSNNQPFSHSFQQTKIMTTQQQIQLPSLFPITCLHFCMLRVHMTDAQVRYLASRRDLHDNGFVSLQIDDELTRRMRYPQSFQQPDAHFTARIEELLLETPPEVEQQLPPCHPITVSDKQVANSNNRIPRNDCFWRWRLRLAMLLVSLCVLASLGLSIAVSHGKLTAISLKPLTMLPTFPHFVGLLHDETIVHGKVLWHALIRLPQCRGTWRLLLNSFGWLELVNSSFLWSMTAVHQSLWAWPQLLHSIRPPPWHDLVNSSFLRCVAAFNQIVGAWAVWLRSIQPPPWPDLVNSLFLRCVAAFNSFQWPELVNPSLLRPIAAVHLSLRVWPLVVHSILPPPWPDLVNLSFLRCVDASYQIVGAWSHLLNSFWWPDLVNLSLQRCIALRQSAGAWPLLLHAIRPPPWPDLVNWSFLRCVDALDESPQAWLLLLHSIRPPPWPDIKVLESIMSTHLVHVTTQIPSVQSPSWPDLAYSSPGAAVFDHSPVVWAPVQSMRPPPWPDPVSS